MAAREKFRVKAEGAVVLGHKTGEEFSFPENEPYNVEALVKAGVIEPAKAARSKAKEE
jgi:hypothetical protein